MEKDHPLFKEVKRIERLRLDAMGIEKNLQENNLKDIKDLKIDENKLLNATELKIKKFNKK